MKKTCPGCGMASIPVIELAPRPVPEGRVLFVATVTGDHVDDDLGQAVAAFVEQVTPGRGTFVLLAPGDSLDMLTDDQLADVGLQRVPQ